LIDIPRGTGSGFARDERGHIERLGTMVTAIGVLLLALPFLIVGCVAGALTYVLGTPTMKKRK